MVISGEQPALIWRGQVFGYQALEARVVEAAARLRTLGIGEDTAVAVWAANCPDWVVLAHAIPRARGVIVPLNTRLTDDEIAWQCARANVKLVLADEALAPRAPGRVVSFAALRDVAPSQDPVPREVDPDRPHAILFTSGTSGRPKGVVLTWANQLASARASAAVVPIAPEDRWLLCLPLFHVGGLNILYRCWLAGACVLLHDSFSAEESNRAVDIEGATLVSFVDVMLRRTLEQRAGEPFPSSLRAVVVGGGPVSRDLIESCAQAIQTYGLTETCSMVTLVRPGAGRDERMSAGPPLPGIEIRIAEAGGEIQVRGPVVMRGYVGDESATLAAFDGGWLRTGDLGAIDGDGCLHVLSRREDLILSGGENVYPAEIEAVLREHPLVLEAVVVPIAHATWGQVPLAVILPRGPIASPEELRNFVAARLARYKVPEIALVPTIPYLPNGKPDRAAIRRLYGGGSPSAGGD